MTPLTTLTPVYVIYISVAVFIIRVSSYDDGQLCDPDVPSRLLDYKSISMLPNSTSACSAGQYLDLDQRQCRPCPLGSFMTKAMSERGFAACILCARSSELEVISEPCSATRDTTLLCVKDFFRQRDVHLPCASRCTRCEMCGIGVYLYRDYESQPCGGYNDTICCYSRDMRLVHGMCRPWSSPQVEEDNSAGHVNTGLHYTVFLTWLLISFIV
ncbi:hypothetical protein Btru_038999 [Bulinus truncatus]|nr:hypothetical protein Btru_038999 [Bulinus truncatus]